MPPLQLQTALLRVKQHHLPLSSAWILKLLRITLSSTWLVMPSTRSCQLLLSCARLWNRRSRYEALAIAMLHASVALLQAGHSWAVGPVQSLEEGISR